MPRPTDVQQPFSIDRPLRGGFAPYALASEQLIMIPTMPGQQYQLHAEIFSKPQVMRYLGKGKTFTFSAYQAIHLDRAKRNLTLQYEPYTGRLSQFGWTIITHDGIAGRLNLLPYSELAFCICPSQGGRALARRASELVIAAMGEEALWFATVHPFNYASAKTLEAIRYPDGTFVFFRDPQRQNVPNQYGKDQPRDYFVSKPENRVSFSFFSFSKGLVQVDMQRPEIELR